ncbi:MAG: hypothetical protein RL385_4865, partial [Pseudomonadota bacterium]
LGVRLRHEIVEACDALFDWIHWQDGIHRTSLNTSSGYSPVS